MTQKNREDEKAVRELSVFLDFAGLAERRGLRVRPESAVNRRPVPAPVGREPQRPDGRARRMVRQPTLR